MSTPDFGSSRIHPDDLQKVVEAISQVEVDGPIGTMRVEAETHHAVLPNYLARVNDSAKLEILKSYEPKPPVAGCKL